jgi:hypothetical protein
MSDQVNNRFFLVASFYGPGNIISWLCTVASLFVTWCLHAQHRRKDTITTDLIFALAVPSVAAGHAIAIIFFPAPSERQQTIGELFTAPDDDVVQRAAAVEAALNVCETFSMIAVALIFVSIFHGHLKRTLAVLAVGLFAFSTEAVVFVQARGRFSVASSNLSRPFLFNFMEVMICIMAFLALWTCVFSGLTTWLRLARSQEQWELVAAEARLRAHCLAAIRSLGRADGALGARGDTRRFGNASQIFSATQQDEIRRRLARKRETRAMSLLTYASFPFVILSFVASSITPFGLLGVTAYMSSLSWTARLPFFIPKSATGITELDQTFALCIGVVGLLYNLLHAFRSRRKEEEILDRGDRQKDDEELAAKQQRTMSLALNVLQLLEEQLGQAADERERGALLERRNQFLDRISRMA